LYRDAIVVVTGFPDAEVKFTVYVVQIKIRTTCRRTVERESVPDGGNFRRSIHPAGVVNMFLERDHSSGIETSSLYHLLEDVRFVGKVVIPLIELVLKIR
jgi:hypothetical protein